MAWAATTAIGPSAEAVAKSRSDPEDTDTVVPVPGGISVDPGDPDKVFRVYLN
jgi:hypothetical protein